MLCLWFNQIFQIYNGPNGPNGHNITLVGSDEKIYCNNCRLCLGLFYVSDQTPLDFLAVELRGRKVDDRWSFSEAKPLYELVCP